MYAEIDLEARLASDPVRFPRRYRARRDREVAGLFAAGLAYGRVDLFAEVLEALFAILDRAGGPAAFVDGFEAQDAHCLRHLRYRFNTGIDFALLVAGLRRLYARVETLESLLLPVEASIEAGLVRLVEALRAEVLAAAPGLGLEVQTFNQLPRGLRYLLPSPASGSACKRWNLYLRWMVRSEADGVDLGIWDQVPASALVVPLDTHVLRIARFIGLTHRRDGSWRTALEVTEGLRRLDPIDPVRFDFSLAHLGISGACQGARHPRVCPSCPLDPVCRAS